MQTADIKIWRDLVESAQLVENDQQIKKIIKDPFQITKIKSIDSAIWSNNQVKKAIIKFMLEKFKSNDDYYLIEILENLLKAAHVFDSLKKLNCPWPELTVILNHINTTINDIINKSSRKDLEGYAYHTYEYVTDNIKKLWPLVEPIIMKGAEAAYLYAVEFKGPWPEAEPVLIKHHVFAAIYAERVLKRPWPQAEPSINKGPRWAVADYNDFVKKFNNKNKQPIKENDEQIGVNSAGPITVTLLIKEPFKITSLKSVDPAVWSNTQVKKSLIKFILKNLQSDHDTDKIHAVHAFDELKRKSCPWPELGVIQTHVEDIFKQIDPEVATYYARYILKRPWPDAEAAISTDARSALIYAEHVLKRRWITAEPVIMKSAWAAYHYAKDILKRPWPEAEATIMNDLLISKDYMEFKSKFEKDRYK